MTGSAKKRPGHEKFVRKTTGYEYFKKQNDRVLKKNFFDDNNKTLCHLKVLILLDIRVLQPPRVTPSKSNFTVSVYKSSK